MKQIWIIALGLGGKNLLMCFFGVIPDGGENTTKSTENPGQSRNKKLCFFLVCFCSLPILAHLRTFPAGAFFVWELRTSQKREMQF